MRPAISASGSQAGSGPAKIASVAPPIAAPESSPAIAAPGRAAHAGRRSIPNAHQPSSGSAACTTLQTP